LERLVHIIGWLYISSMLLWFALRLYYFDQVWWLAILNTIAFYLFLPLTLLIPLALWQRARALLVGLGFLCLLFLLLFGPHLLPAPTIARTQPTITVMTFNVLWNNHDYTKIQTMLHATNPDVVGLQEVRPIDAPRLFAALASTYPYHALHTDEAFHTVAVVSRFPLSNIHSLANPPLERGLHVSVNIDNHLIDVLIAHLAPNNMPFESLSQFAAATTQRYTQRAAEVALIRQLVEQRHRPMLVLCDCNMTDTSEAYAKLRQSLGDSFREAGWGWGHTLRVSNVPMPIQRIDYVWYSDELQPLHAAVGPDGGSDHFPLVVTLQYQTTPENSALGAVQH
jgi:endonuclease/exonuclease/phosphatase (EEP) superfamily protein YafD